jgi:hypothetical protein
MIRKYAVVLIRTIHFALGASLGTFSMFWFTSEIRDFNGLKTPMRQQVLGTALVVAAYMGVAALATRDVRASSLMAICVALFSSPVYLIMVLASGWSTESAERAKPLDWYLAANAVLLASGIIGFVLSPSPRLPSRRTP